MYCCLNTTFNNLDALFLCCFQRIVTGCIGYHRYDVITISGYHVLDCRYGCCRIVIEACRYIIPSTVVTFLVKLLIDSNHKLRLECRRQESYLYSTSRCAALSCGTSCHHCYCHNYCQQNTKQSLSFFHSHFLLIFFVFLPSDTGKWQKHVRLPVGSFRCIYLMVLLYGGSALPTIGQVSDLGRGFSVLSLPCENNHRNYKNCDFPDIRKIAVKRKSR